MEKSNDIFVCTVAGVYFLELIALGIKFPVAGVIQIVAVTTIAVYMGILHIIDWFE